MSTGLENKFKFDFNKPDFQSQFGGQKGTLSEKRKQDKKGNMDNVDDIISASAEGLDSVTNLMSLFMGKNQPNQQSYTPPPPQPQQSKVSPFIWIGGGLVLLLLIALLISSKNGQATQ